MNEEIIWVDGNGIQYTASEIDDQHLVNIIGFVCRGGGIEAMRTPEIITSLFIEVFKRGLNLDKRLVQKVIASE